MTYQVQGNVVIDDSRNGYFENIPSIQKPVNISPAPGEENIAQSGFELKASAFAGVYKTHYASEWQVANASSFATNNIVINSGNITPGSNVYTVSTTLAGNTLHYWRVRYHSNDSPNVSSSFSETSCFRTISPPSVLGESYGGGYYTGTINIGGGVCYYLIVAPNATGCTETNWKCTNTASPGNCRSFTDGYINTYLSITDSIHYAGNFTATRTIGGFSDWYLPAAGELFVMRTNCASMPAGEGYCPDRYWSSTEYAPNPNGVWTGNFSNPVPIFYVGNIAKTNSHRVRAIRRIPV